MTARRVFSGRPLLPIALGLALMGCPMLSPLTAQEEAKPSASKPAKGQKSGSKKPAAREKEKEKEKAKPAAVPAETADSGVAAILALNPTTPAECTRAAKTLAELGRDDLAKDFLKKVVDAKLDEQQLFELGEECGSTVFVELAARQPAAAGGQNPGRRGAGGGPFSAARLRADCRADRPASGSFAEETHAGGHRLAGGGRRRGRAADRRAGRSGPRRRARQRAGRAGRDGPSGTRSLDGGRRRRGPGPGRPGDSARWRKWTIRRPTFVSWRPTPRRAARRRSRPRPRPRSSGSTAVCPPRRRRPGGSSTPPERISTADSRSKVTAATGWSSGAGTRPASSAWPAVARRTTRPGGWPLVGPARRSISRAATVRLRSSPWPRNWTCGRGTTVWTGRCGRFPRRRSSAENWSRTRSDMRWPIGARRPPRRPRASWAGSAPPAKCSAKAPRRRRWCLPCATRTAGCNWPRWSPSCGFGRAGPSPGPATFPTRWPFSPRPKARAARWSPARTPRRCGTWPVW